MKEPLALEMLPTCSRFFYACTEEIEANVLALDPAMILDQDEPSANVENITNGVVRKGSARKG